jgi:hypothetical protein
VTTREFTNNKQKVSGAAFYKWFNELAAMFATFYEDSEGGVEGSYCLALFLALIYIFILLNFTK